MAHEQHGSPAEHHPGPAQYIRIGIILAVITAVEVGIFYLEDLSPALMAVLLLVLSGTKFVLVVGYFMHLRFDDKRFAALFVFPMVAMIILIVVVMALFFNLTR